MVRVPRITSQQVAPGALPIPQQSANASGADFGADIFEAIGEIAANETKKANNASAAQGEIEARGLIRDRLRGKRGEDGSYQPGLLQQQGEVLFGNAGSAPDAMKEELYSLLEGMNPGARAIAQPRFDSLLVGFGDSLSSHEAVAREVYYNAGFKAQMDKFSADALESMTEDRPNLGNLKAAHTLGGKAISDFAELHGEYVGENVGDWAESQSKAFLTDLYTGAVGVLVKEGKYEEALTVQEELEALGGEFVDTEEAQRSRKNVSGLETAERIAVYADEQLAAFPVEVEYDATPHQNRAKALEAVREQAKADGLSADQVERAVQFTASRYDAEIHSATAQLAEKENQFHNAILDIAASGAYASSADLAGAFGDDWDRIGPAGQARVRSAEAAMRDGWSEPAADALYDKLASQFYSSDPRVVQAARDMNVNAYSVSLGVKRSQALRKLQTESDESLGVIGRVDEVVTDFTKLRHPVESGESPSQEYHAFKALLGRMLQDEAANRNNGRPLNAQEAEAYLRPTIAEDILKPQTIFDDHMTVLEAAADIGIPERRAMEAYHRLQARDTGREITLADLRLEDAHR